MTTPVSKCPKCGARCYQCDEKRAKKLNLPGDFGKFAFFCSMRCAAINAVEGPMVRQIEWCKSHGKWIEEGETCYECDREAP